MTVFSDTDHEFFADNGYLAVPAIVLEENLEAAINAICEFLQVNRDDPKTWYRLDLGPNGIVPLHHAQAFWDNRQYPKVCQVFTELLGIRELWVTMDRASFKPPYRREWPDRRAPS